MDIYGQIIKELTSELGLDSDTAAEILNSYLEQLPDEISNLKNAIENNDFATGAAIAHSLKGTSGNLRVVPLFKITADLEQALKNSQTDAVSKMMAELETLVEALLKPQSES